jgi:hypothetical protein
MNREQFKEELEHLINKHSMENGSNTPDFVLTDYLMGCLDNFNRIIQSREKWYGRVVKEPVCVKGDDPVSF